MMLVEPVERLKTIAGGIDLVALTSQNVSQQFTEDVFVVDHKDKKVHERSPDLASIAAPRGRTILNSVNSPGCVSTSIDPACCLTMMS